MNIILELHRRLNTEYAKNPFDFIVILLVVAIVAFLYVKKQNEKLEKITRG